MQENEYLAQMQAKIAEARAKQQAEIKQPSPEAGVPIAPEHTAEEGLKTHNASLETAKSEHEKTQALTSQLESQQNEVGQFEDLSAQMKDLGMEVDADFTSKFEEAKNKLKETESRLAVASDAEKTAAAAGTEAAANPEVMGRLQEQALKENSDFDEAKYEQTVENYRQAQKELENSETEKLRSRGIREELAGQIVREIRGLVSNKPKTRDQFKESFIRQVAGKGFDLMKADAEVDRIMQSPQLAKARELFQQIQKLDKARGYSP